MGSEHGNQWITPGDGVEISPTPANWKGWMSTVTQILAKSRQRCMVWYNAHVACAHANSQAKTSYCSAQQVEKPCQ
jgi:NADH:ubiquinone oxidoreductase subunit